MGSFRLSESERATDGKKVRVLKLGGDLDAHAFPSLQDRLESLVAAGAPRVVLDCRELDYISSAGLGVLKKMMPEAREAGGDIRLAALSPKIGNIVKLLGFSKIFRIYDDVEAAASSY